MALVSYALKGLNDVKSESSNSYNDALKMYEMWS